MIDETKEQTQLHRAWRSIDVNWNVGVQYFHPQPCGGAG